VLKDGVPVEAGAHYLLLAGQTWQWSMILGDYGWLAPEGLYSLDGNPGSPLRYIMPYGVVAPPGDYPYNGAVLTVVDGGIVTDIAAAE
jgi:hypothetical protein